MHVGCVMDGNGRWAQRRGLRRTEGHAAGEEALWDVVDGALELGVRWLTVYAFSTENWKRPVDEVRFLMNFNRDILTRRRDGLTSRGCASGSRAAGLAGAAEADPRAGRVDGADEGNRRLTLTFAFNYGGRAEIIDAVRAMMNDGVSADDVSEKVLRRYLYEPDMPDPDLVIRTSGEFRISNFLLWELAYSELVFTPVLWPDFRKDDLAAAIREYQERHRRFGGVET